VTLNLRLTEQTNLYTLLGYNLVEILEYNLVAVALNYNRL
jgi:hypothetical protein